jgi:serine/threonine-protein kinase
MGEPVWSWSGSRPTNLQSVWEHPGVDPQDDPEALIRELERPLSDAAGTSELGAAKRRTTAGFRARTLVLGLVAIGLVVLAAAVAVVIARHSSGGSSPGVPGARPSSTTSRIVTPATQPVQTLYHLLPQGYNSNNCSPVSSPNRQALATLQCGQTSDPHSPASAAFSLYPNATDLADAFQNGVDEDTVTQCPNGNQSPGTWATDAAPNVSAGSVLCGNYDNRPDLMWTNNHDLLLSDIQGPDLNALYQFWQDL